MKINGTEYCSLWEENSKALSINAIDQRLLPFRLEIAKIATYKEMVMAIKEMTIRGAPLIGIGGAYAIALALQEIVQNKQPIEKINEIISEIRSARPTAVNLMWAVDRIASKIDFSLSVEENYKRTLQIARQIYSEEVRACKQIAKSGFGLIENLFSKYQRPLNILTHCNAGWLATVDWGTALAPIYYAHRKGIPLHVWVDETRPRNQGAKLTSFELLGENIAHTIIADNTGGLLMQTGKVDAVIVGADRITSKGDVCNKVGTYLKALASKEHNIPFWVAFPTSTIDWEISDYREIPIEERSSEEIDYIEGEYLNKICKVRITPTGSKSLNYAFDITPNQFVSKYITELGVFDSIQNLKDENFT
ncbi:MAG: S-methyl-5-thioribose-1-phosphate isomerase [Bacteroidota bacterium]